MAYGSARYAGDSGSNVAWTGHPGGTMLLPIATSRARAIEA
jgi:hypothetical protein